MRLPPEIASVYRPVLFSQSKSGGIRDISRASGFPWSFYGRLSPFPAST